MKLALIHIIDDAGPVDPGFGRPGGGWNPTDPGYGRPGWSPGHPEQGLPGGGHVSGQPIYPGGYPSHGLPGAPGHPSQGLPGGGHIENGLPVGPGHPWLPGMISGDHIDNSLPVLPDVPPATTKPIVPGEVYPPLPPSFPAGIHAVLVWISGLGYRYTVIDTSLGVDNTLPPEAAPKY